MDIVTLTWPAAIAIIASVVTLSVGAFKIMGQGKSVRSLTELHTEHKQLSERVQGVERQMVRLESDLQGTITSQISDLKSDIRRIDRKMDTLVSEVVSNLTAISKKD